MGSERGEGDLGGGGGGVKRGIRIEKHIGTCRVEEGRGREREGGWRKERKQA